MARVNPYQKYLKGEDLLQRAVMNYIEMQYPKAIFTHPMNEGKRSPFEQYKMKYLAIELKHKYNKPTPNQKE